MNQLQNKSHNLKLEISLSIGFSLLMIGLSLSGIVYIPLSEERYMDLSLVPVLFASMIGGYKIAIPTALTWSAVSIYAMQIQEMTVGTFIIHLIFAASLVFFYQWTKKLYPYSPLNVYRTIIAAIGIKGLTSFLAISLIAPYAFPQMIKDSIVGAVIELAICLLTMHLLIDKLREIHILNGVKRKEKTEEKKRPSNLAFSSRRVMVMQEKTGTQEKKEKISLEERL